MGFRFRKRVSLGRFARINLSKSGISLGLGPPGANVNLKADRVKTTLGVPGSGMSYQEEYKVSARGGPSRIAGWLVLLFAVLAMPAFLN